jgi:hypothetical protein
MATTEIQKMSFAMRCLPHRGKMRNAARIPKPGAQIE